MKCHIALQVPSQGTEDEVCMACKNPISRGAQMNGVAHEDGTPVGCFCDECIRQWEHVKILFFSLLVENGE